jgi:hypothetical protein
MNAALHPRMSLVVLLLLLAPNAGAATPEQVDSAIKRGVEWLYTRQSEGHWEQVPAPTPEGKDHEVQGKQWGGLTAIVTYALLASGQSHEDPRLAEAIRFLKFQKIEGTYALAMRTQVWTYLPKNSETRGLVARDARLLRDGVKLKGAGAGHFGYYDDRKAAGRYDHSCSNFGVLGLWACAEAGALIERNVWQSFQDGWRRHQYEDGSWSYIYRKDRGTTDSVSTASMTSAGVATLFITQEYLNSLDGVNCTGNIADEHIERGMAWLAANFSKFTERHPLYTLYNYERIGVASGHKYFGGINWYDTGAEYLVRRQGKDGNWGSVQDTCFALLFLNRGRAPVVMGKLNYEIGGKPGSWNQRPRDVANICRWMGRQIERDLNFQIVNLKAPVAELLEAPVLFISGSDALSFTAEERDKLKAYIQQGGMIVGNADCGRKPFIDSFTRLAEELFPQYKLRELPEDHPIFTEQLFRRANWKTMPELLSLGNGAREMMLLFPRQDPARLWQIRAFDGEREILSQLMTNIVLYAVDKRNLRYKGEAVAIARNEKVKPSRTVKVARLEYDGNWDPEPAGWQRLAIIMHNDEAITLQTEAVKLGAGALAGDFAAAHLTGTGSIELSEAGRAELKKYIEGGGTLIIDAAGGSSDFGFQAGTLLQGLLPGGRLELLKPDHPVYGTGRTPLVEVTFRPFAHRVTGRARTPRLRGLEVDGRTAALFSPEDLSVGLVGQPIDGITGYEPSSAAAVMSRAILYAAGTRQAQMAAVAAPARPAGTTQPLFDGHGDATTVHLEKFAPGWSMDNAILQVQADAMGRKNVLVTRPQKADAPAVLAKALDVPMGKTVTLRVIAGCPPGGGFDLALALDGWQVERFLVDPANTVDGWMQVSYDLSGRAGTTVKVELRQQARQGSNPSAYWGQIIIESR